MLISLVEYVLLWINYLDRVPPISSDLPSPQCHLAWDSPHFQQASGASRSRESPYLSALGDKDCIPGAQTEVTGSRRSTELSSPVWLAFPESLYSRGQRSKILWALGELFLSSPSALSSAHPLPQNSKQLLAPELFLERLHSRKTEARNISKAWPQLSAGAHLKAFEQKISFL